MKSLQVRAEIVMFHHTGFVWFQWGYRTMHCDALHRDGAETVWQDSLDRLIEAMGFHQCLAIICKTFD